MTTSALFGLLEIATVMIILLAWFYGRTFGMIKALPAANQAYYHGEWTNLVRFSSIMLTVIMAGVWADVTFKDTLADANCTIGKVLVFIFFVAIAGFGLIAFSLHDEAKETRDHTQVA